MSTANPTKAGWSLPRATKELVTADGVKIHATVRGTGDIAVVVAHGFSGGHRHGSHARLLGWFAQYFTVIAIDQRGHGQSSGGCTLSHLEPMDVDAAVAWARELGAEKVVTVGFSMGAASVLRQAALSKSDSPRTEYDESVIVSNVPDAVVVIGGAAQWWYRGSRNMRILHLLVNNIVGRWFIASRLKVRLQMNTWPDEFAENREAIQPIDPQAAARALAPMPLLIVQGTHDDYFPVDHGQRMYAAASSAENHRSTFWLRQGMAHAEAGTDLKLVAEVAKWVDSQIGDVA